MIYSSSKLKKIKAFLDFSDTEALNAHDFGAFFVFKEEAYKITWAIQQNLKYKIVYIAATMFDYRKHNRNTTENMTAIAKHMYHIQKVPYYQKNKRILHHTILTWNDSLIFMPEDLKTEEIMAMSIRCNVNSFRFMPIHLVTQKIIISLIHYSDEEIRVAPDGKLSDVLSENPDQFIISDRWLNDKEVRWHITYGGFLYDGCAELLRKIR